MVNGATNVATVKHDVVLLDVLANAVDLAGKVARLNVEQARHTAS